MNEEINNRLLDDLFEAHGIFENTIKEMQSLDVFYPYSDIIRMEEKSFNISFNAISKMNEALEKYNYIKNNNDDFFNGERRIMTKYIMLYLVSIIMLKVFCKTLSVSKINEIWYALAGLVLGSLDAGLACGSIDEYRYDKKENRDLMNDLKSYKEEYKFNYDVARREISYMYSLNRNLVEEIPEKHYNKK